MPSTTVRIFAVLLVGLSVLAATTTAAVAPVWQYNFRTPQGATNPVVNGDVVYVPTNTTLHALNVTSGALLWTFEYSVGDVGGYAAASNQYVYVGTHNGVYALTLTGQVRWVWPNPYSATVHSMRPTIGQDGVYVTSGYAPLMKLRHEDGVIQWFAPNSLGNAQLHATEGQAGDLVYVVTAVGANSYAVCLNAATGAYQWNVSGVVTIIVSESVGLLFCQGGSALQSTLTAVRLGSGTVAYVYVFQGMQALDYYLHDSTLYVNIGATGAAYPTSIIQYNAATGQANWQVDNVSFLFFIPCASGIVNFGTSNATAFGAAAGAQQWVYDGVAVNDGATTTDNFTVMITQSSVLLLPSF